MNMRAKIACIPKNTVYYGTIGMKIVELLAFSVYNRVITKRVFM